MDVNNNQQSTVREKADAALKAGQAGHNKRQLVIWILALAIGAGLGWMGNSALNELFNFIAQVYTRLFPVHRRSDHFSGGHYHPGGTGSTEEHR